MLSSTQTLKKIFREHIMGKSEKKNDAVEHFSNRRITILTYAGNSFFFVALTCEAFPRFICSWSESVYDCYKLYATASHSSEKTFPWDMCFSVFHVSNENSDTENIQLLSCRNWWWHRRVRKLYFQAGDRFKERGTKRWWIPITKWWRKNT